MVGSLYAVRGEAGMWDIMRQESGLSIVVVRGLTTREMQAYLVNSARRAAGLPILQDNREEE